MNLGGIRLSFPDGAEPLAADLNRVLRYLQVDSAKPPRWYTEDGLEPGQWVHFDARMNYDVIGPLDGAGTTVLVFWEVPDGSRDGNGPVRLLLHGSPRHLVNTRIAVESAPYSTVSEAPAFLRIFADLEQHGIAGPRPSIARVRSLLAELDTFPTETACSVMGYARVTIVLRSGDGSSIVLASPLFVEYSR